MPEYQLAPSILSANFARLGEEVDNVIASGADIVHFDVMDNHYVPNLTIGPLVCEALRNHGVSAPIDVHLMVKPVDRLIPDFASAGASYITFHPEASDHIDRSLSLIRDCGCLAGLVFNPATPLSFLDHVLDKVDMILLMSVNPGFGGQSFVPSTLGKLKQVRQIIDLVQYVVKPVDRLIPDFASAGASYITFHPEASDHIDRSLSLIRDCGCLAGLVFNPATPLSFLDHVLDKVDMILLMSVNPGFGGQSFVPSTLGKLKQVRQIIDRSGLDIRLEVDGGVKVDNIAEIAAAGADTFVAGSGIFGFSSDSDDNRYDSIVAKMRGALELVGTV